LALFSSFDALLKNRIEGSLIKIFFKKTQNNCSTWGSLTLLILFSEMLKFSSKKLFSEIYIFEGNKKSDGIFGYISFFKMEFSK
jgi:hypothetical protein